LTLYIARKNVLVDYLKEGIYISLLNIAKCSKCLKKMFEIMSFGFSADVFVFLTCIFLTIDARFKKKNVSFLLIYNRT